MERAEVGRLRQWEHGQVGGGGRERKKKGWGRRAGQTRTRRDTGMGHGKVSAAKRRPGVGCEAEGYGDYGHDLKENRSYKDRRERARTRLVTHLLTVDSKRTSGTRPDASL